MYVDICFSMYALLSGVYRATFAERFNFIDYQTRINSYPN